MAETKLNQSPIEKIAMNNIPIGNSIVENGVRCTVIESSVKFYKMELGTNVANNLQNLNEEESKETEPSRPFSPGPGIPDGNEDSEKTRQSEDSSSDQRTLNEKSEEIKQSADKLSKQSQSSFGQRTAYEKSNGKVSNF